MALVPGGLAVAVVIAWAASGGGYETQPGLGAGYNPDSWYLGALALVGVFGAAVFGIGRTRLSRLTVIALSAFSGYVVWSYLSILWAHDQGTALLGCDRTLVYLLAFATFAILPWRQWTLIVTLTGLVTGFGVIALITAVKVGRVSDPASLYVGGRLAYPLGYENASAALFMLTAITSIALAARRRAPMVLRVGGLVLAAVCLQLAVLSQSRGWLFTAPIILLLTLAVLPGRVRFVMFALGPALAAAAAAPALLKVYGSATVGGAPLLEPRLGMVLHVRGRHATHAMLIIDAVLLVIAIAAVALDRRLQISEPALRRVNRLAAAGASLAALAGLAVGLLSTHGHVVSRLDHAWNSFANAHSSQNGTSRFSSLGSVRVDFWRVALHEFADHPLQGIGQDNFAAAYVQHRRTGQEPRWVHSLELRLLTHTGVVGAALFLGFLTAALLAALRMPRGPRGPPDATTAPQIRTQRAAVRVSVATALAPLIVWVVHGSIDWLWEFPALSVPALAFLGAATALARPPAAVTARASSRTHGRLLFPVGAAATTLAALVVIAIPYVAAREVQTALAVWPSQPAKAYRELHAASDLLPFNAQTGLVGGSIALNRGEPAVARQWFEMAVRRDDRGWLARFALGLLATAQRRRAEAQRDFAVAHELDPSDALVAAALTRSVTGHPLTLAEAQASLAQRSVDRFGQVH